MNGNRASSLQGLRVLITRPAPANEALADAVRRAGGEPIAMPAVETRAVPREGVTAQLGPPREVALAVFVSLPAVQHGSWLLHEGLVRAARVGAIGNSTAAALEASGIRVDVKPVEEATSEGLLQHPLLHRGALEGEVLIVRGQGGRELLADTLRERGLQTRYAQVYARCCPSLEDARTTRELLQRKAPPHIITATSLEILNNALLLLGSAADKVRAHSHVLAPSDRIAAAVAEAGFQLPPLRSRGADNKALVSAMEAWWGTRDNSPDGTGHELI